MQVAARAEAIHAVRVVARPQAPAAPARGTGCSSCHVRGLCLPTGMGEPDLSVLDGLMFGRHRVKEGRTLYREGDRFHDLYAVRSGTFKSTLTLLDGREQVTGFQMAGDLLALDGPAAEEHATNAVALEDAEVCSIPYARLAEAAIERPDIQQVIARLMSREIVRERGLVTMLGSMGAEARVAIFLLDISDRLKARGYSHREFHLRMSRADVGSYLGMKLETVSRALSAFQQEGSLSVDKKHLRILDFEGLIRRTEMCLQ